jgi:outer membrane protein
VRGSAAASLLLALADSTPVLTDTIEAALVRSYQNNPQLNAPARNRQSHRRKSAAGIVGLPSENRHHREAGEQYTDTNSTLGGNANQFVKTEIHGLDPPRAAGLTITQTLYNGNQTANKTRAARESGLWRARGVARA